GHYWLNLAYYLKAQGIHVVVVNPMKVKRSKEMDDDSPTKNDTKDAKVIAQIIRDGRYHEPTLPEDVYAELREGMKLYDMIQEDMSSIKAQMHNALDRYFPEFLDVFKDWTGKAALQDIKKLREVSIKRIMMSLRTGPVKLPFTYWKEAIYRKISVKLRKKICFWKSNGLPNVVWASNVFRI